MLIKDLMPPLIIRFAEKIIKGCRVFSNFDEVVKFCSGKGYEESDLCKLYELGTAEYKQQLNKKNMDIELPLNNVYLLAAIIKYLIPKSKHSINILDFGGAGGSHYFQLKKLLGSVIKINWIIVETPEMVKHVKRFENKELHFISSIEGYKYYVKNIDLIYTSGALQYVNNPYDYLDKLLKIGSKYILFCRMVFTLENKDIFIAQPHQLPKGFRNKIVFYPQTTMSIKKFYNVVKNNRYKLVWGFRDDSGKIPSWKPTIGKVLLYKKLD